MNLSSTAGAAHVDEQQTLTHCPQACLLSIAVSLRLLFTAAGQPFTPASL